MNSPLAESKTHICTALCNIPFSCASLKVDFPITSSREFTTSIFSLDMSGIQFTNPSGRFFLQYRLKHVLRECIQIKPFPFHNFIRLHYLRLPLKTLAEESNGNEMRILYHFLRYAN